MELENLTAADLVDGKVGKAFRFDNARKTMLKRLHAPGEKLPINQHPAFTISFWAKAKGTGQVDLRLFAEANSTDNYPLFSIGCDKDAISDSAALFMRQAPWGIADHVMSTRQALDGTWHHIAFIQTEDGTLTLHIDGTQDPVQFPPKPAGTWLVDTTAIDGIRRAVPTYWLTGLIDEVALWSRALSETELRQLVAEGLDSLIRPRINRCVIMTADTASGPWSPIATLSLDAAETRWQAPNPGFYCAVPAR